MPIPCMMAMRVLLSLMIEATCFEEPLQRCSSSRTPRSVRGGAVVRSNATLAFAAERQVVGRTSTWNGDARRDPTRDRDGHRDL